MAEWDHLNEIGFGCDVILFWKCHRFHRCQQDTDVDRVQFDRVGPLERDWVLAAMSLSFGNATISIVAYETQMWIECNLTERDHLNEIGFGCDVTLFWKCHHFHRSL